MKHRSPISGNARRPDEGETPSRAAKGVVIQPKLGFENAGVESKLDSSPNFNQVDKRKQPQPQLELCCPARGLRLSNCAILPEPSIITRCQRIHQNPGKVTTSNFQSWRRWARRILRFDALAKRVSHLSPLQELELKKNTNWCCLSPKSLFLPYIDQDCQRQLESWKIPCLSSRLEEWTLSPLKIAPLPRKKKHLSALSYAFEPGNSGCRGRGPRFLCRMYDSEVTVSDAYKLLDQGIKEWIAEENTHLQGNERKGLQKPHTCVEPKMHISSTIKLYIYISIGIRRATP